MKRSIYVLSAAVILCLLSTALFLRRRADNVHAALVASSTPHDGLISAPGRVEAVSEEIRVSSELSGRLRSVPVEEGDRVHKGQVLAQIENDDYVARVSAAEATLAGPGSGGALVVGLGGTPSTRFNRESMSR